MAKRANSPWSKTYKEGLPTTAVNDHVNIDQNVNATITTGVIDSVTGLWKGVTTSDDNFTLDAVHEAVANTGVVLSPQSGGFDMTSYEDLFIAIKPSQTGNCLIHAVMGPSDQYFANLTPVNPAETLRGLGQGGAWGSNGDFDDILSDGAESLTADVWNIFVIQGRLKGQKNLQFKIQNNSGSESNIQFAYLRVA